MAHEPEAVLDLGAVLQRRRQEILQLAARHGALRVRLFGSLARGEGHPGSDVDLLVEMAPERSLLDHVALHQDLQDLLGVPVDIVSEKALHWSIRDRVLSEAVPL